jgi:tetratricopeptide (TPR) repeat protein
VSAQRQLGSSRRSAALRYETTELVTGRARAWYIREKVATWSYSWRSLVASMVLLWAAQATARPPPAPDGGVVPDSAADAGASVRVVRVRDLLLQAVQHYQRSEFEQARTILTEILGYVGKEKSRAAQEAYTYLAFVHVAYGETERAVEDFEKALAINPDLRLSGPAPRIAAAFEQARRRFRAKVRALDHDPPMLVHRPPGGARYGTSVGIVVEARDVSGVRTVTLNYRIAGNRGFSSVNLERDGQGRYVATIPTVSVVRPGIEYYVEAWDKLGNGPGLKGSAAAPIKIEVKGGPRAAPESTGPTPWYKRWWVWAVASGVVLAAGGVGLGIYLSRDETARVSVPVPSGLNPPGGSR